VESVKRADELPPLVFETPSSHKYNNYPDASPNKIHMVDTEFQLTEKVRDGLLLGINFVPFPHHQHREVTTTFTTYSKDGKKIIYPVVLDTERSAVRPTSSRDDHLRFASRDQRAFRRMLRSPQWVELHRDHVLLKTDKNMGTAVVSKRWMADQCRNFLADPTFYRVEQVVSGPDELKTVHDALYRVVSDKLLFISRSFVFFCPTHDSFFPYFYTLPKVHKSPISARPITGAFDSLTSRASKAISECLKLVHKRLTVCSRERGFGPSLAICIQSEDAIRHASAALSLSPSIIEFRSYDFVNMYNNLDVRNCSLAIEGLVRTYCD
jgi:hypothetical protein